MSVFNVESEEESLWCHVLPPGKVSMILDLFEKSFKTNAWNRPRQPTGGMFPKRCKSTPAVRAGIAADPNPKDCEESSLNIGGMCPKDTCVAGSRATVHQPWGHDRGVHEFQKKQAIPHKPLRGWQEGRWRPNLGLFPWSQHKGCKCLFMLKKPIFYQQIMKTSSFVFKPFFSHAVSVRYL